MKTLAYIVFIPLGIVYTTWLYYLAIMKLKDKRDVLSLPAKFFAYPILYIG